MDAKHLNKLKEGNFTALKISSTKAFITISYVSLRELLFFNLVTRGSQNASKCESQIKISYLSPTTTKNEIAKVCR